ncbi:MAG: hypothetical protein AAB328_13505 [candidate division NC10 bacterium]
MRIDLQIGGYAIRLDEPEDHAYRHWPFATFKPFVRTHETPAPVPAPDIAMTVRVVPSLPEIPHGPVLYDACHGRWTWHAAAGGGYLLESPNRSTHEPETRALVSADIASVTVWVLGLTAGKTTRMEWEPSRIINPIVEACLLTRLARDGGLLLHAAGLLTEQGSPAEQYGWAFTGASGAGKSTLSDLYAARGARVLSDERIILRVVEGAIRVFGTPWPGSGRHARNQQGPLTGLFCIRHGRHGHVLRRMPPGAAASFILPQCFLPHWDRAAMDNTLAFLGTLLETVDCFELAFMNRPDIVEFIMEQRMERALTTP